MYHMFKILTCVTLSSQLVNGFHPKVSVINDPVTSYKWIKASNTFDKIVSWQKDVFINFLKEFLSSKSSNKLSPECTKSLKYLENGLRHRELWSYEFIESFPKGDIGFSKKNAGDLGNMNTCVKVRGQDESINFNGKYCLVTIKLPVPEVRSIINDPMTAIYLNLSDVGLNGTLYQFYADHIDYFYQEKFTFGICSPETCSSSDIENVLSFIFDGSELDVTLTKYCDSLQLRKSNELSMETKISTMVISLFLALVFIATAVGLVLEKLNIQNKWTFLQHFNAIKSHQKLFSMHTNEDKDRLRPIDMFICLWQFTAVIVHTLFSGKFVPSVFPVFQEYTEHLYGDTLIGKMTKISAFFAVQGSQTIIFTAGFTNCYLVYPMMVKAYGCKWPPVDTPPKSVKNDVTSKEQADSGVQNFDEKKEVKGVPFHFFVVMRWLRMIPTIGFMIIATFAAGSFITNPVMRQVMEGFQDSCRSGWWRTIFMMNNFDLPSDTCFFMTWYLSLDFQLWILSYIPLLLLVKRPKIGLSITCIYIFIGCISLSVVTYTYDMTAILVGREFEMLNFIMNDVKFSKWFNATHNGLLSYFSGFLVAYLLINTKESDPKTLYRWFKISILCAILAGLINVLPLIWILLEFPTLRWLEIGYASIVRAPFPLIMTSVAIVTYFRFYKYVPLLDSVFNARLWVILKRLTFVIFLSHLNSIVIGHYFFYDLEKPETFGAYVGYFILIELTAYTIGYIIYIIVEAPFASILSEFGKKNFGKDEDVEKKIA